MDYRAEFAMRMLKLTGSIQVVCCIGLHHRTTGCM